MLWLTAPGSGMERYSTVSTFTATAYLKKNELFNFFNQYGKQGIKINIGFK